MEFLFIAIWLICAAMTYSVYKQKGRSGDVGCIAGLLLGPIALVLALASGTNERGKERQALKSGRMKKCPYCAELIQRDAQVCRFCGGKQA